MLVRHRSSITPNFDRTFDRSFDRAFDQLTSSFFDARRSTGPVIDGAWKDDEYVLTVDLPGVPADAVSVDVTGTMLSLGARTDTLEWHRSVRLGGRLDPEKVRASHVDGRLTVRIGAVDEPEARSIAIHTTTSSPSGDVAIDATSSETEPSADADQSTETNETE